MINRKDRYCIIGAGPCGLAAARNFSKYGLAFDGFEIHSNVGGLWDIENPKSTMYESAHLISSKTKMHYDEFQFPKGTADYPHHSQMKNYFQEFAKEFDLYKHYKFQTRIDNTDRDEDGNWIVTYTDLKTSKQVTAIYGGLVIANGIFSSPNLPKFKGQENFNGEIIHSSKYKSADIFNDKRVLVVGAGNSGCDIAVDAVHRSKYVDISVRRGYYFVPKYIFGKPSDTIGGKTSVLPKFIKKKVEEKILKMFTGDPVDFGFPKPDYKLFESHPIVNSLILHHLGHGDIDVMKDIDYLKGNTVYFKDGESREYDIILCATGYRLNYPFLDKKHLNWQGKAPKLHLNIFHPEYKNLFILGMVEATGIGWQGRYDQADLVARYVYNNKKNTLKAKRFEKYKRANDTDLSNGTNYLQLERMAFYVHKETYLKALKDNLRSLSV